MNKPKTGIVTKLALFAAAIAFVMFLIGGPGHRFGLWDYEMGFTLLRYSAFIGIGAAILGAIPILQVIWREHRITSLIAVVIGLFVMMNLQGYINKARQLPAIHDISTDLDNPPQYQVIEARDEAERGFTDAQHRALQEVYYGDIQSLISSKTVSDATKAMHEVLVEMEMDIIALDADAGRIEAVSTTAWFGFKDDVVVRVQSSVDGSKIDIRSVSRVGRSDIGKNAERIREITERVQGKL